VTVQTSTDLQPSAAVDSGAVCQQSCSCSAVSGGSNLFGALAVPGFGNRVPVITQCNYPASRELRTVFKSKCTLHLRMPIMDVGAIERASIQRHERLSQLPGSFFIPSFEKKACTIKTNLTQGEVAAIMICGVCAPMFVLFCLHFKCWQNRNGMWKKAGEMVLFSLTLSAFCWQYFQSLWALSYTLHLKHFITLHRKSTLSSLSLLIGKPGK